jgi:hypothetical protein
VFHAGFIREPREIERLLGAHRERLLAVHVLPHLDRAAHVGGAKVGQRGVEVDRIGAVGECFLQIRGVALDPILLGERAQLSLIAPDEDRIGHQPRAVRHRHSALGSDRDDRAHQMLIQSHASGHAVHDDSDRVALHVHSLRSLR